MSSSDSDKSSSSIHLDTDSDSDSDVDPDQFQRQKDGNKSTTSKDDVTVAVERDERRGSESSEFYSADDENPLQDEGGEKTVSIVSDKDNTHDATSLDQGEQDKDNESEMDTELSDFFDAFDYMEEENEEEQKVENKVVPGKVKGPWAPENYHLKFEFANSIDWASILPDRELTADQRYLLTYVGYHKMNEMQRKAIDLDFLLNIRDIENRPSEQKRSRSGTAFNGNRRYHIYFTKHVEEVKNFESGFKYDDKAKPLRSSFISLRGERVGKYQYSRDGGTYWSKHEKDRFFELLARYSIHGIENIAEGLPNKTEIDILNYYNLLKNETKKYKSSKKLYDKCIRYEEIPAAYEMSEDYIKVEETYARDLVNVDGSAARWASAFSYTRDPQKKVTSLYHKKNLLKLTESLYLPTVKEADDFGGRSSGIRYWYHTYKGLNESVKSMLKKIMLNLIELKLKQLRNFSEEENLKLEFINDNPIPLLNISKHDVLEVINEMKFPHNIKFMKNYWTRIGHRLGVTINPDGVDISQSAIDSLERSNNLSLAKELRAYHHWMPKLSVNSQDFSAFNTAVSNNLQNESKYYEDIYNEFAADKSIFDVTKEVAKSGTDNDDEDDDDDDLATTNINDAYYTFEEAIKNAGSLEDLNTHRVNKKRPHHRAFNEIDYFDQFNDDNEYSSDDEDIDGNKRFIVGNPRDDDLYFNTLAEKMFIIEAKLLDLEDYAESVKNEHIFLSYLSTVSEQLKHDLDFAKYIEYHLNQPEKVGRKAIYTVQAPHNPKRMKKLMGFNDLDDPDFDVPDPAEHGITEDMIHLQSYDFPQKFC